MGLRKKELGKIVWAILLSFSACRVVTFRYSEHPSELGVGMDGWPSRGKAGVKRTGVGGEGKVVCFKYQILLHFTGVVLLVLFPFCFSGVWELDDAS